MHSAQEIVDAKVGHQDGEEAERYVDVIGQGPLEGRYAARVNHCGIGHEGDECPHLFRIPTPIGSPRHVGPDGAYENADAKRGYGRVEKHAAEHGKCFNGLFVVFAQYIDRQCGYSTNESKT